MAPAWIKPVNRTLRVGYPATLAAELLRDFPAEVELIPLSDAPGPEIEIDVWIPDPYPTRAMRTWPKLRGVRLVLAPGALKIISSNAEQEDAQEEIELDYAGDGLDVGFNVTYLLDVLNNISNEAVEIRLNDANSSALYTLPGNDRFKYVVMPMRI